MLRNIMLVYSLTQRAYSFRNYHEYIYLNIMISICCSSNRNTELILWFSDAKMTFNFQNDPELAQLLIGNDLNKLQDLLRERHRQRSELRRQQDEEMVSELVLYLAALIDYICDFNSFLVSNFTFWFYGLIHSVVLLMI